MFWVLKLAVGSPPPWGGVRLSLLGMSANIWPIVPARDGRWWWVWSSRWNENWRGKPKYSEKTCPSATLSTTNPTWPGIEPRLPRWEAKLAVTIEYLQKQFKAETYLVKFGPACHRTIVSYLQKQQTFWVLNYYFLWLIFFEGYAPLLLQ
jgi:hypothetical protein